MSRHPNRGRNAEKFGCDRTVSTCWRELVSRGDSGHGASSATQLHRPLMFDLSRFPVEHRVALPANSISSDAIVATFVGTFGQWHGSDISRDDCGTDPHAGMV